jgi:hypothetical protein
MKKWLRLLLCALAAPGARANLSLQAGTDDREWIGERNDSGPCREAGRAIDSAVDLVLSRPKSRTADLGGQLGCRAFGEAVADAI